MVEYEACERTAILLPNGNRARSFARTTTSRVYGALAMHYCHYGRRNSHEPVSRTRCVCSACLGSACSIAFMASALEIKLIPLLGLVINGISPPRFPCECCHRISSSAPRSPLLAESAPNETCIVIRIENVSFRYLPALKSAYSWQYFPMYSLPCIGRQRAREDQSNLI